MQICEWLWYMAGWLMDHLPYSPSLALSDVHLFDPLKKHLAGKQLQQMMTAGCCFSGYNI